MSQKAATKRFMVYDAIRARRPATTSSSSFSRSGRSPGSVALTSGESLEWTPVAARPIESRLSRRARTTAGVAISNLDGSHRASLPAATKREFPLAQAHDAQQVTFKAADGTLVHGTVSTGALRNPEIESPQ